LAGATVIGALRRFLPDYLRDHPEQGRARRRAVWALTRCRTAAMGGHLHACTKCGSTEFAYHSCNHRACPQCGKEATAQWVERELGKRIGAPYFMVTFTLPEQLRPLFFSPAARDLYELFFAAASGALSESLANPRWLGAHQSGFTMILHTWNQRLLFHPHIHCIVPGAGIDAEGHVVSVKSPGFLVPQPVLRSSFRHLFHQKFSQLITLEENSHLPPIDPSVWQKDWGVHLQSFGDGKRAIQYLGTYVCRTAIGDSRILSFDESTVTFSWKDRAHGDVRRVEGVAGVEFVSRYLRHVLPLSMRAIRRYGFCHPSAKNMRERIAFHTGCLLLLLGTPDPQPQKKQPLCPCCATPMIPLMRLLASWKCGRAPPALPLRRA
jgi:hypothetical protein